MDIPVTTVIPDMTREIEHTMTTNSYDQLPYPNRAHKSANARKLEAVATLFGMHPPSVSKCRVLELGCASGGNLIPQALAAPQSEFVAWNYPSDKWRTGRPRFLSLVSIISSYDKPIC